MKTVMNTPAGCFALFLVPFALGMLGMNGVILYGFGRQLYSTVYSSVPGTITHSAVTRPESSYHFEVRYTYEVDGQQYEGNAYRYGDWGTSEPRTYEALNARLPEGSSVQVFYRPGAPWDSVLVRGVQGLDLFLLLFITPFNVAIYGGLYWMLRSRKHVPVLESSEREGRVYVKLTAVTPAASGFIAAGIANFVALAAVGALAGGFDASAPVVALAWAGVVASGIAVAKWRRARWDAGDYDLILDPQGRRVSLPPMFGRRERLDVAWSQIRSVEIETSVSRSSQGKTTISYRPRLEFIDALGEHRHEALGGWGSQARARAVVNWLKSQVEFSPPSEKSWSAG